MFTTLSLEPGGVDNCEQVVITDSAAALVVTNPNLVSNMVALT
jgi:hypothetical protein